MEGNGEVWPPGGHGRCPVIARCNFVQMAAYFRAEIATNKLYCSAMFVFTPLSC